MVIDFFAACPEDYTVTTKPDVVSSMSLNLGLVSSGIFSQMSESVFFPPFLKGKKQQRNFRVWLLKFAKPFQ